MTPAFLKVITGVAVTIVTMRRRTLMVAVLGSAGAGAIAACASGVETAGTPGTPGAPAPSASPTAGGSPTATASASAMPVLGSTKSSTLAPRDVTMPYVPAPGSAP